MNGKTHNTTIDIKIMVEKEPITIGVREKIAPKSNRKETSKTLYIPCEAWTDLKARMDKIERTKLPPSIKD
jgi:hypothetical protein